jgi:DHA2 family multidrug resistance protein-like MFS transporter
VLQLVEGYSPLQAGLAAAAGIGSALLLASALALWILLKPPHHRQPLLYRCSNCEEGSVPG